MLKLTKEEILKAASDYLENQDTKFGAIGGVKLENDQVVNGAEMANEVSAIAGSISKMFENAKSGAMSKNIEKLSMVAKSSDMKIEGDFDKGLKGNYFTAGKTNPVVSKILDSIKLESFDGQAIKSSQALSLVTNLAFSRPSTFEMVLFPRLHLEGDVTTLEFDKKIPIMFNNFTRTAENIQKNFRDDYYSIPLAMWTEKLIESNSIRIKHILNPESDVKVADERKKHLVEDLARKDVFKGEAVKVAPIAMKLSDGSYNKVDIINLSSLTYGLKDVKSDRDSLNNQISVKAFFVKFTAGGHSIYHKFDVTNKIGNIFHPGGETGDHTLMMANRIEVPVVLSTIKEYNTATDKNDKANAGFTGAVSTYDQEVKLALIPNFRLDFAGGEFVVQGDTAVFETSNTGLKGAVQVELVGVELDSTLANLNLREIGQLLGFAEIKFGYQIEFKDPVSVQAPIVDQGKGNNDDFNNAIDLGTMINAQSAVHAVKAFLSHFEYLSTSTLKEVAQNVLKPVERTVATAYLKPYHSEFSHSVATTNSLNSTSLREDIKNNIMNRIIVEADKMYTASKYNNAFAVTVGNNQKPCVAIVTSNNIAKYLGVTGDKEGSFTPKELTPNLDYIIVTVPANDVDMNKDFYENIYMTFVDPRSVQTGSTTEVCPISFGFTLYKNFMTVEFQRNATESVKYLSAFPCYRHIAQLPIMVKMNVSGLPDMMSNKVTLQVENKAFKAPVTI